MKQKMEPKCHQKKMLIILPCFALLLLNSAQLIAADSTSNITIDTYVNNFCNHASDSSRCKSQFSSAKQDPYSALEIAVNILMKEINSSIDKAKALQLGALDSFAAHGFGNCVEVFSDAVSDLESAKDAIKARDVGSISTKLRAAGVDLGFCGPGFRVNYMAEYCHDLDQMLGYCRLIAAMIK